MTDDEQTLEKLKVMVLDCQTTGASPTHGNILELSWAVSDASLTDPVETKSYLIKQDDPLPPRIAKITGIHDDDLEDASEIEDVIGEVVKSIDLHKLKYCVIHFAKFEKAFLEDAFETFLGQPFPLQYICTHEIAKRLYPDLPSRGIRALAGYFSNTLEEDKRSSSHVIATSSIWHHLVKELEAIPTTSIAGLTKWIQETVPTKRKTRDYPLDRKIRLSLPKAAGIYRMLSKDGSILYIGKAKSLHARVNSYFRGQKKRNQLHMEMLTQTVNISTETTETYFEAAVLENDEIKKISPPYNISLREKKYQPIFYNKDFTEYANEYSTNHPIGPFSSIRALQPLQNIYFTLQGIAAFDGTLLQDIDQEIISEGFSLFSQQWQIDVRSLKIRSLLAIGLVSLRNDSEDNDEQNLDDEQDLAEDEWTAESFASILQGICRHSARQYRRCKELLRLANSQIFWKKKTKGEGWRYLRFENSKITARENIKTARSIPKMVEEKSESLSRMDQVDFDRLRVSLTEVNRIEKEGREVRLYW